MHWLESIFEHGLWSSRFVILLAVFFGLVGALSLFAVASFDVYNTASYVVQSYLHHVHPENFHEIVVGGIIGAVDLYLIGVVMIIFSFGVVFPMYNFLASVAHPNSASSS